MSLRIVPITLRAANEFIFKHHRHNDPDRGQKFSVGLMQGDALVGVAIAGRPKGPGLDDGLTIEVTRTCTDGTRNANSMLYGSVWRASKAMGYRKGVTYTQHGESGASLRAVGWTPAATLPARGDWAESSVKYRELRDPPQVSLLEGASKYTGGVERIRWEIHA